MRVLILLAVALAPTAAFAFEDAATGFAFRAPPGFVETPTSRMRFDAGVGVDSASGFPPLAGTSKHLCEAGFKAAAQNARLTQRQINARAADRRRLERVKTILGAAFDVLAIRADGAGDVLGAEIEAKPKVGPGHEDARVYLAIFETPKGRTTLVCATARQAWDKALPIFRDIRAGITLPR